METRREPVFESEPRKTAQTLAEFARKSQITEDKVWDLIEEGQVSARFVNESILIIQDHPTFEHPKSQGLLAIEPQLAPKLKPQADLELRPPPPDRDLARMPSFLEKSFNVPSHRECFDSFQDTDFAEDSSDVLAFAKDALSRNAELSKELLATKNELLRLKDERIASLVELLGHKDREIRRLNNDIEDIATLQNFASR